MGWPMIKLQRIFTAKGLFIIKRNSNSKYQVVLEVEVDKVNQII